MNGLIFDLDGVIVDTAQYHYLGWKKLADELGVPFDEKRNEQLKGVNRRESLIRLLGYQPEESTIDEWCAKKNSYYLEYLETISPSDILPGAISFLNTARSSGAYKLALASSSKNAPLVLKKLNLWKYFDAVVDSTHITHTKPDPEIFLKAAARIGVKPSEAVVFEDAESGVEAAKKAGMLCIGIGKTDILNLADFVVPDLSFMNVKKIGNILKTRKTVVSVSG